MADGSIAGAEPRTPDPAASNVPTSATAGAEAGRSAAAAADGKSEAKLGEDKAGFEALFDGLGQALSERLETAGTGSWANGTGGYDALTPEQREKAERNFRAWAAAHPDEAEGLDVRGHVAWVQAREAERLARRRTPDVASGAPDPADTPDAPAAEGAAKRDPIRDLANKLERTRPDVERADAPLAATIKGIAAAAQTPGALDDARVRTRIAYALQDVEKLSGQVANVPGELREEMARLARTYPGLRHEGMQELVRATPDIADRGLIRDIRATAASIAAERDQASPDAQSRVDVLANRVGVAARARREAPSPDSLDVRNGLADASRPTPHDTRAASSQVAQDSGDQRRPAADGATADGAGAARDAKAGTRVPPPADTTAAVGPATVPPFVQQQQQPAAMQLSGGQFATAAIMSALRRQEPVNPVAPAPWDRQLTPLKERIAGFMERGQVNRDEAALQAAERSGEAAARALQAFAHGPGAAVMGKIQAAGRTDPNGEAGVVAGMREGGPYQDLRREFDAELGRDKALAAALDRAAAAVGQYGADRAAADGIAAKRADAAAVTARFERLDAEVGAAAATTPSRNEGKSQLGDLADKLGDKAAEIAKRAAEALRAAFGRGPGAGAQPSGPSPSP